MFNVSEIKVSEIQKYVNMSKPGISKHFKNLNNGVSLTNNRLTGISPEAASNFLMQHTNFNFHKPSITLSANLCGGVSKTSSICSLAAALRRITSRKTDPIVLVDGDSQASFTHIVCGKRADDNEATLIDYIERKATIHDLLHNLGNGIFFVKSNLNSAFLDKTISRPSDIKKTMKDFYSDIFKSLGNTAKIFQDHTPQLSNLFASSICALYQMPSDIICNVIIPIRSDDFAIQGANYIINEINELVETYSFPKDRVNIHSFFSALDGRVSSTGEAIKKAMSDDILKNYLCPLSIRYSSEVPKSIMSCTNIYSSGKTSKATEDYQDLLQYIFN